MGVRAGLDVSEEEESILLRRKSIYDSSVVAWLLHRLRYFRKSFVFCSKLHLKAQFFLRNCKNQLNRITVLLLLEMYPSASACNIRVCVQCKPLGKYDCNLVTNDGRSAVCVR